MGNILNSTIFTFGHYLYHGTKVGIGLPNAYIYIYIYIRATLDEGQKYNEIEQSYRLRPII
jgi:hypothetical protein